MIDEDKIVKKYQGKVICKDGDLNKKGRILLAYLKKNSENLSEQIRWMNYFRFPMKYF